MPGVPTARVDWADQRSYLPMEQFYVVKCFPRLYCLISCTYIRPCTYVGRLLCCACTADTAVIYVADTGMQGYLASITSWLGRSARRHILVVVMWAKSSVHLSQSAKLTRHCAVERSILSESTVGARANESTQRKKTRAIITGFAFVFVLGRQLTDESQHKCSPLTRYRRVHGQQVY